MLEEFKLSVKLLDVSSFSYSLWNYISESQIFLSGKFKPVIKKAMVELEGRDFWGIVLPSSMDI